MGTTLLWRAFIERVPFALFFIGVVVIAWWRGFAPAVGVALLAAITTAQLMAAGGAPAFAVPVFLFGIAVLTAHLISERTRSLQVLAAGHRLLEEERARFATVLQQMPVGVVLAEAPSGRLLMSNEAASAILKHPVVDTTAIGDYAEYYGIAPDGRRLDAQEYPLVRALTTGEVIRNEELAYRCGDGVTRTLSINAAPIHDAESRIVGGVAVFADVTETRAVQQQLQHSQRLEGVGRLAGGIAHDFNNLLTIIVGSTALAREEIGPKHGASELLDQVTHAADRATDLTRQLLAFSRRQILRPQVIELNALVANLGKMLARLIGEDVTYVTRLAPELWRVKADPGQIEQIVVNLVINARDAMPEGGRLTVETANADLDADYARQHADVRPGHYVMLAVSDTGVGMDRETQARIFEPFFTTKAPGQGTGLGLSTVYGIVKQSGGHIWVYTEPGHGSSFKIYLPRAEAPAEPEIAVAPALRAKKASEVVLLVEDEAGLRALARRILTNAGYTVLDCQSADEALFMSRSYGGRVDLLLTDVVLQGASGREIAEQLAPLRPGIKVLYMSGYTDNAIVHHGVLDAGVAFLEKPFSPEKLLRSVREVLDADADGERAER